MIMLTLLIVRRTIATFLYDVHRDLQHEKTTLTKWRDNGYTRKDISKEADTNFRENKKGYTFFSLSIGCSKYLYLLVALIYFINKMFEHGSQVAGGIVILLLCSSLLRHKRYKRSAILMDILSLILMVQLGFILNGY